MEGKNNNAHLGKSMLNYSRDKKSLSPTETNSKLNSSIKYEDTKTSNDKILSTISFNNIVSNVSKPNGRSMSNTNSHDFLSTDIDNKQIIKMKYLYKNHLKLHRVLAFHCYLRHYFPFGMFRLLQRPCFQEYHFLFPI